MRKTAIVLASATLLATGALTAPAAMGAKPVAEPIVTCTIGAGGDVKAVFTISGKQPVAVQFAFSVAGEVAPFMIDSVAQDGWTATTSGAYTAVVARADMTGDGSYSLNEPRAEGVCGTSPGAGAPTLKCTVPDRAVPNDVNAVFTVSGKKQPVSVWFTFWNGAQYSGVLDTTKRDGWTASFSGQVVAERITAFGDMNGDGVLDLDEPRASTYCI